MRTSRGCVRLLVGWSVTHSFEEPHGAAHALAYLALFHEWRAVSSYTGRVLSCYSAMHKKRYKFSIQDFYAQKLLKRLFFMRDPKSWKKWSDWHQSQTFWSIWLDFIISWKVGVVNWCKIFKWLLKLTLIISRFFELTWKSITSGKPFKIAFIWVIYGICCSIRLRAMLF